MSKASENEPSADMTRPDPAPEPATAHPEDPNSPNGANEDVVRAESPGPLALLVAGLIAGITLLALVAVAVAASSG